MPCPKAVIAAVRLTSLHVSGKLRCPKVTWGSPRSRCEKGESANRSKLAGGKIESSSKVGMRLRSGSVTEIGPVESGVSLGLNRMASAPGMDRLLHGLEDPVVPRAPPTVPTKVSAPSAESSFAAFSGTPERGSLSAPSRTQWVSTLDGLRI